MDVLVVGGSVFLGRAVVDQAIAAGHDVTVFNRGLSGTAPDGAMHVRGDRTVAEDLAQLAGRRFDLVVDTCGYVPADVALAARALRDAVGHYAFVSSISAYPRWPAERGYAAHGVFDGRPDATRDTVPDDVEDWQHYGWLKVGCERAVEREFGAGRCALLRAGGIVGPDDSAVGRLPWWLDRFAQGGDVLVCGGPAGRDTWADLVLALQSTTSSDSTPTWVDGAWLAEQDVEPWTEIPFWTGDGDASGTWAHDNHAAEAAGLRWRPLVDTVADTRAWQVSLPESWTATERTPGLAPAKERELLAAWRGR